MYKLLFSTMSKMTVKISLLKQINVRSVNSNDI